MQAQPRRSPSGRFSMSATAQLQGELRGDLAQRRLENLADAGQRHLREEVHFRRPAARSGDALRRAKRPAIRRPPAGARLRLHETNGISPA